MCGARHPTHGGGTLEKKKSKEGGQKIPRPFPWSQGFMVTTGGVGGGKNPERKNKKQDGELSRVPTERRSGKTEKVGRKEKIKWTPREDGHG